MIVTIRHVSVFAMSAIVVVLLVTAVIVAVPQGNASKAVAEFNRELELQNVETVRSEAATKLAIPQLVQALADEDELVGIQAANALGEIGESAIEPIMDSLDQLEKR